MGSSFFFAFASLNIKINKVATVAEGLSSFYTLPKEERAKDLVILDIGGRTWNICVSSGGKCIMKFTVPGGMIDLYSEIQEDYNKLGNNADVEEIIRLIKNLFPNTVNYSNKNLLTY